MDINRVDLGSFAVPDFVLDRAVELILLCFDIVDDKDSSYPNMVATKRILIAITGTEAIRYSEAISEAVYRLGRDTTSIEALIPSKDVRHLKLLHLVGAYPELRQYFEAGITDLDEAKALHAADVDVELVRAL